METKNQTLRVEEGRTELIIQHNEEDLTFIHLYFGPNNYANVQELIETAKLEKPTMSQTASLVHSAFNSKDKYSLGIQKLLKEKWLWAFTGILYVYVKRKGVYIQDIPEIRNRMPYMNESDLEIKLEKNDPNVRFVPFGFKTERMSPKELAKNEFVIGLATEEGADNLAEIAGKFDSQPYLFGLKDVAQSETRVSALDSDWCSGHRLDVYGDGRGDYRGGCAFGYGQKISLQAKKAVKQ